MLLVQCKTKRVTTSDDEGEGEGQSVSPKTVSDSLVNCSEFVGVLGGFFFKFVLFKRPKVLFPSVALLELVLPYWS